MCDFALSAFPFGNTNSTVDTALLGLPNIAHFGPECPAQSDRGFLRLQGYRHGRLRTDEEFWLLLALEFVTDPKGPEAIGEACRTREVAWQRLGNK